MKGRENSNADERKEKLKTPNVRLYIFLQFMNIASDNSCMNAASRGNHGPNSCYPLLLSERKLP